MLLKISLLGSGLFFLLSIYAYYFITTPLCEINKSYLGKSVCVKADFYLEKNVKNCIIGKISDKECNLKVFSCKSMKDFEKLKNKKHIKNIKICGKIESYKGELEIKPFLITYS